MGHPSTEADIVADSPTSVNLTIPLAVASWQRYLRAANKAPRTIQTYLEALTRFEAFPRGAGMPLDVTAVRREHVESWFVHLQEQGRKPAAVASRS